jgi:hypothetical protein
LLSKAESKVSHHEEEQTKDPDLNGGFNPFDQSFLDQLVAKSGKQASVLKAVDDALISRREGRG